MRTYCSTTLVVALEAVKVEVATAAEGTVEAVAVETAAAVTVGT